MKYIAYHYSYLGKFCNTPEEAQKQARGMDFNLDAKTGFSVVFNVDAPKVAEVIEIPDESPSEGWKAINEEEDRIEKELRKEFKRIRNARFADIMRKKAAFINLNTSYEYGDTIELVIKFNNGHLKTIIGEVCGVTVLDSGEIRPNIRGKEYKQNAKIVSINIKSKHDYSQDKQETACANCIFCSTKNFYEVGHCNKRDILVEGGTRNKDCYERDPKRKRS